MYIHLYIKVSLIVIHDCSRTAIQATLIHWPGKLCRPSLYNSYSDAQASILWLAAHTCIVHPVITKCTEAELATVSGCMHAYQTSFMHNVSSSYFDAASLPDSFLHLLACLGAWTSRRGLAWRVWSGLPSSFMMSSCS